MGLYAIKDQEKFYPELHWHNGICSYALKCQLYFYTKIVYTVIAIFVKKNCQFPHEIVLLCVRVSYHELGLGNISSF